jgi:hypothetical protein
MLFAMNSEPRKGNGNGPAHILSDKANTRRWAQIPIWVAAMGLSGCELRVLIVLASHRKRDDEKRIVFPSLKTIAELAVTTVSKVSLAIKKLEARGSLLRKHQRRTEHGDYDSTLYELFPDGLFPDGMVVLPQKVVPTAHGGSTVLTLAAVPGTPQEGSLRREEESLTESLTEKERARGKRSPVIPAAADHRHSFTCIKHRV